MVFRMGSWPIKAWADQANVCLQNTTFPSSYPSLSGFQLLLDSAAIFTCHHLSPVIRSSHQPDHLCVPGTEHQPLGNTGGIFRWDWFQLKQDLSLGLRFCLTRLWVLMGETA